MSAVVDQKRGQITKNFGGRSRTFKFGMRSSAVLSGLVDFEKLSKGDPAEAAKLMPATFLSGLVSFGEPNGVTEKTDLEDVEGWIFDMGEEDAADVWEVSEYAMGFLSRMQSIKAAAKARK